MRHPRLTHQPWVWALCGSVPRGIGAVLNIDSKLGRRELRSELIRGKNSQEGGTQMTESSPIKVLLVDDHAVVRSGLGAVLMTNDDMVLVGEANNGEEAIRFCEKHTTGCDFDGLDDAGYGWGSGDHCHSSTLA